MSEQKYFLGIDWGKNKTGLALADAENLIATSLREVDTKNLTEEIKKISTEYNLGEVIFGISETSADVKEIEQIKELGLSVVFENEDFSTLMAQRNIQEFREKKITKQDNAEAARIILQSWLDRIRKK
ncbi:MAG: RuvX/YqgF family protein [Patescibacteria group bacterium]|jgi:RNase H-fold protein (predicted Holliday junction resolvase)|nr:RuvX/YqgF family protein [Patescibacteria group bacterium]